MRQDNDTNRVFTFIANAEVGRHAGRLNKFSHLKLPAEAIANSLEQFDLDIDSNKRPDGVKTLQFARGKEMA